MRNGKKVIARWDPKPLTEWTNWVCRWRNKARAASEKAQTLSHAQVGMPCNFDQERGILSAYFELGPNLDSLGLVFGHY